MTLTLLAHEVEPLVAHCYVLSVVRGRRNPAYYGLPDRLRQARRRRGLSMPAASSAIGGSNAAAFLIERRQSLPRINTIERFAAALGVSPSWLAYGEGLENLGQTSSAADGLGKRLEVARKARGLSRQALGKTAGLTGQTVANAEVHGMIPRVDTVEMLARALGVSASWLAFGLTPDQPIPSENARTNSSRRGTTGGPTIHD